MTDPEDHVEKVQFNSSLQNSYRKLAQEENQKRNWRKIAEDSHGLRLSEPAVLQVCSGIYYYILLDFADLYGADAKRRKNID